MSYYPNDEADAPPDAAAWAAAADALAAWAMPRYFARTDRYGGYRQRGGAVVGTTCPPKGPAPGAVTVDVLRRHFRATGPAQVVGAHTLNPDTATGLWAAIDVDAHVNVAGEIKADPDANRRFAEAAAKELAALGFRSLCYESNGLGGYHVLAFMAEPVPGTALAGLANYAARDWRDFIAGPPEIFPKQTKTGATGFGNWLRVIGRHHTLPHWPKVFDPTAGQWLDGAAAVALVLALTGDDPALIPFEALAAGFGESPSPDAPREAPRARPKPGGQAEGKKPGDAYTESLTVEDFAAMMEPAGWRLASLRGGVAQLTRPGKAGGNSASIGYCRGRTPGPRLYVWTSSAPPFEKGRTYTPFWVRAHLYHGGDLRACARALADEGFGEPRQGENPGSQSKGRNAGGADGGQGDDYGADPGYGEDEPPPGSPGGPKPEKRAIAGKADEASANRKLVTRPASEIDPEEVRWLWPGRLPFGMLSEILGDPGCGKSTLTAELAAATSTGRPLPGGERADPGDVLFLSAEDSAAHTIRPRLEAAGADLRRVHILDHVECDGRKYPLTLPDHFDLVRRAIGEHAIRLIVVDPLNAFLAAKVEANDDKDVRSAIMYPLRELAEGTGVAVLLVRHLNKGSGKGIYRGGNSIGFTGAVRVSLAAGKTDDGRRVLVCNKMNIAAEPPGIEFELVHDGDGAVGAARVRWGGEVAITADELFEMRPNPGPGAGTPRDAAAEFLLAILADGPRRAAEVFDEAEAAGLAAATVKRASVGVGVVKVKKGFGKSYWEWSLPREPAAGWHEAVLDALRAVAPEVGVHARAVAEQLAAAGTPLAGLLVAGVLRELAEAGTAARHGPDAAGHVTWSMPGGRPPASDDQPPGPPDDGEGPEEDHDDEGDQRDPFPEL